MPRPEYAPIDDTRGRSREICETLTAGDTEMMMLTLVAEGETLPEASAELRSIDNLIHGCTSTTYFRAYRTKFDQSGGLRYLRIEGESNSAVLRGIISLLRRQFDGIYNSVDTAHITWHVDSGLMQHLTPQRQAAVLQMIERIKAVALTPYYSHTPH